MTALIQGTSEWLSWRRQGIGGSDAPVVMGVSPFKTPLELWREKTGQENGFEGNWATRRGNELEPVARAHYELLTDVEMAPALFVHPGYPFMRASLDGWNQELRRVLEIKCPGKEDHATAKAGRVPAKYVWQIQHQLFVTGGTSADYFSFDGEAGVVVTVEPDQEAQAKLLAECEAFWKCVTEKVAPKLTDRDFLQVALLSEEERKLEEAFVQTNSEIERLEKIRQAIRERYITTTAKFSHPRIQVGRVRVVRSVRKGSLDFKKLEKAVNLTDQELEQYRKKESVVTTVSIASSEGVDSV